MSFFSQYAATVDICSSALQYSYSIAVSIVISQMFVHSFFLCIFSSTAFSSSPMTSNRLCSTVFPTRASRTITTSSSKTNRSGSSSPIWVALSELSGGGVWNASLGPLRIASEDAAADGSPFAWGPVAAANKTSSVWTPTSVSGTRSCNQDIYSWRVRKIRLNDRQSTLISSSHFSVCMSLCCLPSTGGRSLVSALPSGATRLFPRFVLAVVPGIFRTSLF